MDNNSINATASKIGQDWNIKFMGGMLKHPNMNMNIFATVLCHELGHHIGGGPYKKGKVQISVEGQADYFTSNTCLKDLISNTSFLNTNSLKIPTIVKKKCQTKFTDKTSINTCINSNLITIEISKFLSSIGNTRRGRRQPIPRITKRSKKKVSSTLESHPDHQCRLDTYFEGSLCEFGLASYDKACPDNRATYQGSRPNCWYKKN